MAGEYVDPFQAILEAQRAKIAQPQAPMYSPEEQAQRVAQNQREYEIGMLGLLSGDQGLGGVGGHVLKQAMAARQPRVTERGTTDQLRGTHTYFPEFLRQQDEDKYAQMQQRSAQAFGAHQEAQQRAAERADLARQRSEDQRALHALIGSNRPEPLVAIVGSDGKPVLVPRSQANGMTPYSPGGSQPGEDERKAGGWLQQASLAFTNMAQAARKDPEAVSPTIKERAARFIPFAGDDVAFATMSEPRQQYTTAASSFSEAVLRAATGAGVNKEEALQKINELTPRIGESPGSIADKQKRMEMYLQSLELRAGRALPGIQAAGVLPNAVHAATNNDPLGLFTSRPNPGTR